MSKLLWILMKYFQKGLDILCWLIFYISFKGTSMQKMKMQKEIG